jgi:uracil phosphoribosyltransferase
MKFKAVEHPLLSHWLSEARSKETKPTRFRHLVKEMTRILVYEASKNLSLSKIEIETPLEKIKEAPRILSPLTLITIMRAGNVMLEEALDVLEWSRCGHIGLYRNPSDLKPIEYYFRMPEHLHRDEVWILDPMLATGGSAEASIKKLIDLGVENIKFLCLVAAPEAIQRLEGFKNLQLEIYAAALDRELNSKAYILPGLGDAGDRIYATLHS